MVILLYNIVIILLCTTYASQLASLVTPSRSSASASFWVRVMAFIREDFPTLERLKDKQQAVASYQVAQA